MIREPSRGRGRRARRLPGMLAVAAPALVAVAAAACGPAEPGKMPEPAAIADVEVSVPAGAPQVLALPATVEASREAELSTRISGRITEIAVDVGSRVQQGQVLVSLDAGDVAAAIGRAEASERQARRTFDRLEALERDGAATAQELDDARAALEMAEAALQEARTQSRYAVLTAPFSGWVTARLADPGDLTVPGRPILSLIAEGGLKIVADVPAGIGARLRPGDSVTVHEPASGALPARIARVAPAVQTEARLLRVEAELAEGAGEASPLPLPGAFVRLQLRAGGSTLWVPEDAVVRRGQLTGVWLVDGEVLRLRWIRPGQLRPGSVEVLAGLTGDELVVRRPSPLLADGQPVGTERRLEWDPDSWSAGPGRMESRPDA